MHGGTTEAILPETKGTEKAALMPYGLPSATTTTAPGHWRVYDEPEKQIYVKTGVKVEPLHMGADQDGFSGYHVICRVDGLELAIKKESLLLK
jgi:hypothetical protein